MQETISVLLPYFGAFPPAFSYFAEGVERNPHITVHWLTDQAPRERLPSNLVIHNTTLDEIRLTASKSLNINVSLEKPYKICDLRPAFGEIFQSIIGNASWWGWCDCDVVWGNLEGYLQDRMTNECDAISVHNLWLSGAFTILRNRPAQISAFRAHPDWEHILSSPSHFSFGECSRRWHHHMKVGSLDQVDLNPPCFTRLISTGSRLAGRNASLEHAIKEWIAEDEILEVNRATGKIVSLLDGREYPLFHWVLRGRWKGFTLPNDDVVPEVYFITREGFWRSRDCVTPIGRRTRRLRGYARHFSRAVARRLKRIVGVQC